MPYIPQNSATLPKGSSREDCIRDQYQHRSRRKHHQWMNVCQNLRKSLGLDFMRVYCAHISTARIWKCPLAWYRRRGGCILEIVSKYILTAMKHLNTPFGLMRGPNALKNQRWLFNFFLFCSLRQNIIWIGHWPIDTSPPLDTTMLLVYLLRV